MKKLFWSLTLLLGCGMALTSCSDNIDNPGETREPTILVDEQSAYYQFKDPSVTPGDNFWAHCLGNWLDLNPYSAGLRGVLNLQKQNEDQVIALLPKVNHPVVAQLTADYQASKVEDNIKLLGEKIDNIKAAATTAELWELLGKMTADGHKFFLSTLFDDYHKQVVCMLNFSVDSALIDYDTMKTFGWPVAETDKMNEFVTELWEEINSEDDEEVSRWMVKNASLTEMAKKGYVALDVKPLGVNSGRRAAAETDALGIMLKAAGFQNLSDVMAASPQFEEAVIKLTNEMTLDQVKWLAVHDLVLADYPVATLQGTMNQQLSSLAATDNSVLNGLLNQAYVASYCKPQDRQTGNDLFLTFKRVFTDRINNKLTWLSAATKQKFIDKLNRMDVFMGWPDDPDNYFIPTTPTAGNFYADVLAMRKEYRDYLIALVGKTDMDSRWALLTAMNRLYEGNAYNLGTSNSLYIFASNLIYPVVDYGFPMEYLYAGIGAGTIGHEMTHSFDSKGALLDADGYETENFNAEEKKYFNDAERLMEDHFSQFDLALGENVDGEKTLAENIADMGGLFIGYDVWMEYVDRNIGATGYERDRQAREFFRAWAWAWSDNRDEQAIYNLHISDNHSPNRIRVNGTVTMMDEWYRLFNVTEKNKMYFKPSERVIIW